MKKKHILYIINIVVILLLLTILSVLLYPTVSEYINSKNQAQAVVRYLDEVKNLSEEDMLALWEEARAYNERLLRSSSRYTFTEQDTEEYQRLLDTGRGIMGVLEIGKINVKLPVYHGTSDSALQIGLGHYQGSSLPVGGNGIHSIITGHTGLPSSTLFTRLDKLTEGDTFMFYVLGETLTYQVDDIMTVLPHEMDSLEIDRKQDYITLVTCTPYGVNSHRLLVRGKRIANAIAEPEWEAFVPNTEPPDTKSAILLSMLPILAILLIATIFKYRKIRKKEKVTR